MTEQTKGKAPHFIAYSVAEGKEKSRWREIGAAWYHNEEKDGLTVELDAVPSNGAKLVLRVPKPKAE